MSDTFLSSEPFIDKIQRTIFPIEIRFENIKPKPYIRAYGISYVIKEKTLDKVKITERGNTSYSQNAFEESILNNKSILSKYLELIYEVLENGFMDQYQPGHKCIIFCRKVNMCKEIVDFLKHKIPNLDIRKYTEGDPYENLIDPDIRVTTQISAGTNHDIPGLVTNITTDNINSKQANLQCLGRLRDPKQGIARYFAVYSESIPKHVKYHKDRKQYFQDSAVLTFKDFRSHIVL